MEIQYILLPQLKREIHRADLTRDQVFLCCMPPAALPVDQMHNMQDKSEDNVLDPVPRKLPLQLRRAAFCPSQRRRQLEPWGASPRPRAPTYLACLFEYTNGRVSTTGNKPSSGNCLRIDLGETIKYASTPNPTIRGYTLL